MTNQWEYLRSTLKTWDQSRSLRRLRFFLKIIAFSHIQTNVDRALLARLYLQSSPVMTWNWELKMQNLYLLCLNNLKALHWWWTTFWGNEDGPCFETPQSRLLCSQSTASWSHFNVKPLGAAKYTGYQTQGTWPKSHECVHVMALFFRQAFVPVGAPGGPALARSSFALNLMLYQR